MADVFGYDFIEIKERKKRLGQYFTGIKLARLLAALADSKNATSIIDPMCGSGDMLIACLENRDTVPVISGIDIDPIVHKKCVERLRMQNVTAANIYLGNAFDAGIIKRLPKLQWDLVITNPPYVRYQALSKNTKWNLEIPDARQVRNELLVLINNILELDNTTRDCMRNIASNYSGLADLAVPSWILCTGLVKTNGILAMVVPDSWLNRDYAQIIHYLLLRCFKILYVVEDADASWFDDALIKTNLIVAKRVESRKTIFNINEDEGFIKIRLSRKASNSDSIVGELYKGKAQPELCFANNATEWLNYRSSINEQNYSVTWFSLEQIVDNMKEIAKRKKWYISLEGKSQKVNISDKRESGGYFLSPELVNLLDISIPHNFVTLKDMMVNIGQGLRTGANVFFYVEFISEDGENAVVAPDSIFEIDRISIPKSSIKLVLRKQTETGDGFEINYSNLKGRVLVLDRVALPEDIEVAIKNEPLRKERITQAYKPMPEELADYVRKAASINIGSKDNPKYIPKLSAVSPNVRKSKPGDANSVPRFWYMLPEFKPRHRPDIVIARVNSAMPRAILNRNRESIIDANFSTIWIDQKNSCFNAYFLLSLLNSTWCIANMELSASVMGGGALKLEATHLRRIPIPKLDSVKINELSKIGIQLAKSNIDNSVSIIEKIDKIVMNCIFKEKALDCKINLLKYIIEKRINDRRKL
jgi:type I restriction-modification system DNA methylase subunit